MGGAILFYQVNSIAQLSLRPVPGSAGSAYPDLRFPPRAGMAPVILTCPAAAMGATGKVTDPGMSEAISGCQQKQEVLLMTEKPNNKQGNCHTSPKKAGPWEEVLATLAHLPVTCLDLSWAPEPQFFTSAALPSDLSPPPLLPHRA